MEDKKILEKLAELSDQSFGTDDVTREGRKIILPENQPLATSVQHINAYYKQQRETRLFHKKFKYAPFDGALALQRVLIAVTGAPGVAQATQSFFGSTPPSTVEVQTDVDSYTSVPWGELWIPTFDATLQMGVSRGTHTNVFHLQIECETQYGPAVTGLFAAIEAELANNSMYRGKSFDVSYNFIGTDSLDPNSVMYPLSTEVQLDTHVWSPIRDSDVLSAMDLPTKRAVLLHGPFGTGKTLAAMLTAQVAKENGWTFVYAKPGQDMYEALEIAKLYEPCVVFIEDADTRMNSGAKVSQLLDAFDGMTTKHSRLHMVLTTNYPDRIEKGMIRPGRLDALIHIGAPDLAATTRFVNYLIPPDRREDIDYERVFEAMEGYLPAFVKEALDRVNRHMIAEFGVDAVSMKVTTQHIVDAANGLRAQWELMNTVDDATDITPLEEAFQSMVQTAVEDEVGGALSDIYSNVSSIESRTDDTYYTTERIEEYLREHL